MSIIEIAQKTRLSARKLAVLSADAKNQAIEAMAKAIEAAARDIVAANAADCKADRRMELRNRCTIASSWMRASEKCDRRRARRCETPSADRCRANSP